VKRISAIAISLLLIIGLTAEAQAVTSGSYRCVAVEGSFDGTTLIFPEIIHYNPNATGVQSIRRIRIFDSLGVLLSDESSAPGVFPVAGRGSFPISVSGIGFFEGLQVIVNWSQTVDGVAPIPRLNLYNFDGAVIASAGQSNCP
jgi:hypothetical protein